MSKKDYKNFNKFEDEEEDHKYQEIGQESDKQESEIEDEEEEEKSQYEESELSKSIFDESNRVDEEIKQSNSPKISKPASNTLLKQNEPFKMSISQNYQPLVQEIDRPPVYIESQAQKIPEKKSKLLILKQDALLTLTAKKGYRYYDFGVDLKEDLQLNGKQDGDIGQKKSYIQNFKEWIKNCCKKSSKLENTKIETENPVQKRFKRRVILRYCFVLWIPAILLSVFFALYFLTKSNTDFRIVVKENLKINLNMTRCQLYLHGNSDKNNEIFGDQYLTYKINAFQNRDNPESNNSETLEQSSFTWKFYEETNEFNISVISVKENVKSCYLSLNIPENLVDQFNIQCFEKCFIIQDQNVIKLNSLNISSFDDVYTNFYDLRVKYLEFKSQHGYLQLNHFEIDVAKLNIDYGDIILQSTNDLLLNWVNEQQTFCFAAPQITSKISNCYISGQPNTESSSANILCGGETKICLEDCSKLSKFTIYQKLGNLYVNRIDKPYTDISYTNKLNVSKGGIYDNGIDFEPYVKNNLDDLKGKAKDMATDSIFILELGRNELRSSSNSFWTVISNPSFAYLRPWWLATFSLSLLTSNSHKVSGYLSPGICPYHIKSNINDVFTIQNYLKNFFHMNTSVISFVEKADQITIPNDYLNGTGIYEYEQDRPITEKWFSVGINEVGYYEVKSNGIEANGFIIAAMILGFIFAAFVGSTVFLLFKAAIMMIYKDTLEKSKHTRNYVQFEEFLKGNKKLEKDKKKPFDIKGILEQSSLYNFMKQVPRISDFVGYYSLSIVKKYFINSVDEFLSFLMNPHLAIEKEKVDKGIGETRYLEMKEKNLKNNYEKFCFLNQLIEKPLSDNVNKFNVYGYTLIEEEENLCKAFTKMSLKEEFINLDKFYITPDVDSLDLFIENYVNVTNSETDYEFIDDFTEKYHIFCDKYRLLRKEVRPDLLTQNIKYKFGITIINRKKLIKKLKDYNDKSVEEDEKSKSVFQRIKQCFLWLITCGSYVSRSHQTFLIDENQMKYHFDIMINPDNNLLYENLDSKNEEPKLVEAKLMKDSVINKMIYHSYWYYWVSMDIMMILIQQIFTAACIIPFLFLVILQETSYAPFSIIDPNYLITKEDVFDNPWQIPGRIGFFNIWNIIIISICIFFMVYSFLDCFLYFCNSSFPDDRSFEKNQEILNQNKILKFFSNCQWILIFFIVFCYSSYVGLVCVWLLLGAIINPNNFLVYSTAALTFLMFVSSKYSSFKKISDDGFKIIRDEVNKILQKQIKFIIGFMIEEVKELTSMGKSIMQSNAAKFAFEKADEFGVGDEVSHLKNLTEKTLDNPEKLVNNAISTASAIFDDPNLMIVKLREAEEELKKKAIEVFKTKCKAYNISEGLVDLFLHMNFKDEEKMKICLSELIEKKSEEILNEKIHKELVKSILDLVIHPKNVRNPEELAHIITQELIANLFDFSMKKILPKEAMNKDFREIYLNVYSALVYLKNKNTKKFIPTLKNLVKNLVTNSVNLPMFCSFLDIIDLLLNMKNESRYKHKMVEYLNNMNLPVELTDLLTITIFSSSEEQIIEFKNKKFKTIQHYSHPISHLLLKYEREDGSHYNKEDTENIAYFFSFFMRGLKNQNEFTDYEKFSLKFCKFLQPIIDDTFEGTGKKYKIEANTIKKILSPLPYLTYFSKDPTSFWKSIAKKYEVSYNHILELIYLITEHYWQGFLVEDRYDLLKESDIIKILCNKLRMGQNDLVGLIAIFYDDFYEKNVNDFLNGLIDYQKNYNIQNFRTEIKLLLTVTISQNCFNIYNSLKSLLKAEDSKTLAKTEESFIRKYMEDNKLVDESLKLLLNWENPDPSLIGVKPLELEDLLKKVFELKKTKFSYDKSILNFINRLKNLFTIKKDKYNVKQDINLKKNIAEFAKEYKYDETGLEYLFYILLKNYQEIMRALDYFLQKDKEKDLFNYKPESYKQIVKTIINEDEMISGEKFKQFMGDWIPSKYKDDTDLLRKCLEPVTWKGIDVTNFVLKLTDYDYGQDKQKNIEMKKKLSTLFHIKDVDTDNILNLFPVLNENVTMSNIIKQEYQQNLESVEDYCYFEGNTSNSRRFYESILIDELTQYEKINYKEKFIKFLKILTVEELDINILTSSIKSLFYNHHHTEDAKKRFKIDLTNENELKKSIVIFKFLNTAEKSQDLHDYFVNTFKISNYDDLLKFMKHYFTTDVKVFAKAVIPYFKEFHGKLNELTDIFSICTDEPAIESLSNILGFDSYSIESAINICKFYAVESNDKKIEILRNNDSWFNIINVNKEEFLLFYKFVNSELNNSEFNKFISTFGIDKYIDNKILCSIFSIYAHSDNFENSKNEYNETCKTREYLFNEFEINDLIGNILCELSQEAFWNIKKFIESNKDMKNVGVFPANNATTIIEILCTIIGTVINNKTNHIKIKELFELFANNKYKISNDKESVAYLWYTHFKMSPLIPMIEFEDNSAKNYMDDVDKNFMYKWEQLMKVFDEMTLEERNQMIEYEFLINLLENTAIFYEVGDTNNDNFLTTILKENEDIIQEEDKSNDNQNLNNVFPDQTLENNQPQQENSLGDYYDYLNRMDNIFIPIFKRLYLEKMISTKNIEAFLFPAYIDYDAEIKDVNINGSYHYIIELFSLVNNKGILSLAPNLNTNNAIAKLLIINSVFKMRKLLKEKQIKNNENDSYEIMIKFGLELDFVLTSIEKIKFLDEEYETFENFQKNSILKLVIPLFFYDVMNENNDFILEFFFRYSIFEDDKFKQINNEINENKECISKILKLSRAFKKLNMNSYYLTCFYKESNTQTNIGNNIEQLLSPNLINKLKTFEDLNEELISESSSLQMSDMRKKFLLDLIDWKRRNIKYKTIKYYSFEALEEEDVEAEKNQHDSCAYTELKFSSIDTERKRSIFNESNMINANSISIFNNNCKTEKIITSLSDHFNQMMKGEINDSSKMFNNILRIYKGNDKYSADYNKALEYILAKISTSIKSNFLNLKLMLEYFSHLKITEINYDKSLQLLNISPKIFYGVAIPYLKSLTSRKSNLTKKIIAQIPDFIKSLVWSEEEIKLYLNPNLILEKIFSKAKKNTKSPNQRIRDLFIKTKYGKVQKDKLVILMNCFAGDKSSWKKLLSDYEEFSFKGNEKFEEFIEIMNIFDHNMRKSYSSTVIKTRSISEFIIGLDVTELIQKIFKDIRPEDVNNLLFIKSIIDKNHTLLLKLMNFCQGLVTYNMKINPTSYSFYLFKLLLFVLSLSNPYIQLNKETINNLISQIEYDPSLIEKLLGIDHSFFNLLCEIESGNFNGICKYLSIKDDSFLFISSFNLWFNAPFLAHLYSNKKLDFQEKYAKMLLSNLFMIGIIELLNIYLQDFKKNIINDQIYVNLKKNVRENMNKIYLLIHDYKIKSPPITINWFTINKSDLFDGIFCDFTKFLMEDCFNLAENPESAKKTKYNELKMDYIKDLQKIWVNFSKKVEFLIMKQKKPESEKKDRGDQENYDVNVKKEENQEKSNDELIEIDNKKDVSEKKIAEDENKNEHINQLVIIEDPLKVEKINEFETIFKFFSVLFYGTTNLSDFEVLQGLLSETINKNLLNRIIVQKNAEDSLQTQIIIELTLLGFEIIEKQKNDRVTFAESFVYSSLYKAKGKFIDNYSEIIDVFNMLIYYIFLDDLTIDKDSFFDLLAPLLNQLYINVIRMLPQDVFDRERMDDLKKNYLETNKDKLEVPEEEIQKFKQIIEEEKKTNQNPFLEKIKKGKMRPDSIIYLVEDIYDFIKNFTINSIEIRKTQIRNIALKIGEILFPDNESTQKLIDSVFNLIQGDFKNVGPELFNLMNIDKKTFKIIKNLLIDFKKILEAPQVFVTKKINYLTDSLTGKNISSLDVIKDKLKIDKDMEVKDLFKVFDTDKSGKINLEEFKLLTKRLNMTLSDHRIKEIFTSVKGDDINISQELDEVEFEKALGYLQEKSIMLTLEYLGITQEILFGILIWLTLLLLILFAFIFVGIAAFAIGGTFGSIINSMFPIAGGVGLNQKGEDKKDILNMEKVKEQVSKCVEIIQSFKI